MQDLKELKVSNMLILGAGLTVFAIHLIFNLQGSWAFLLSAALYGVLYFAARLVTKKKLGMADVWFGFFQGLCLGLQPVNLLLCVLVEVLGGLALVGFKNQHKKIPFIPFMSFALLITFILNFILKTL